MDLRMPEVEGVAIGAICASVKSGIIALTTYDSDEDIY